jgi:hypothetical protein
VSKNKKFKVIWEVHLDREHVESLMESNPPERGVHDVVYILSYDKMKEAQHDVERWEDEDGNTIRRLTAHHTLGAIHGDVSETEYEEANVDNWEDLLDNPTKTESGE